VTWLYSHPSRGTCSGPGCRSFGYCHCQAECRMPTSIAPAHNRSRGVVRGMPRVFVRGHCGYLARPGTGCGSIPIERVQPMLEFLWERYGSKRMAAAALGWHFTRFTGLAHCHKIHPRTAEQIAAAVLALQPADRSHRPRPVTRVEESRARREHDRERQRSHRERQRVAS
jgi:hypothetical protein